MGVSYDTIFQKMFQELKQAQQTIHQQDKMKMHIRHLQLLGDLLVTDELSERDPVHRSPDERRVMMGHEEVNQSSEHGSDQHTGVDHGDANGESIFDF
ncbi:MAG TPA: DUF5327 family protein [Bacillota bacterium]|nr:DUF5327 family protein [Bacillota bacterium]